MMQRTTSNRRVKGSAIHAGFEDVTREISHLPALDIPSLRQRWVALVGGDPSPNWGRTLLMRAIAYRLQERSAAGLKPSTQRLLDRIAENRSEEAPPSIAQRRAIPGTVLIREWGGVRHRVTVLDDGVVYQGRRYKSLSEVARTITGARWSGPRFFGLKGHIKEAVND
jgi:Protein of unknown function (DUF2924)